MHVWLILFLLMMMLGCLFSGGPYVSPEQKEELRRQERKDASERLAKMAPIEKTMAFVGLAVTALFLLYGLQRIHF
jgi:hypothetical protein